MIFDATIYLLTALAIALGFNSGLLRSLATILGYVAAAPVAIGTAPALSVFLAQRFQMPPSQNVLVFFGILIVAGMLFAAIFRRAVGEVVGPRVSLLDRVCGALLGAVRIVLLAVLMVVIFDRIIPADRQPTFLKDSELRPLLSAAGQAGLKSLPPGVADYIDQLKRERGL